MLSQLKQEHYGTVIIGAGQAGLSAAYYLSNYAAKYAFPVKLDTKVIELKKHI